MPAASHTLATWGTVKALFAAELLAKFSQDASSGTRQAAAERETERDRQTGERDRQKEKGRNKF